MEKAFLMTLKAVRKMEDETGDFELTVPASLVQKGALYYIQFEDQNEDGTSTTTLKVGEDRITMLRFGGLETQLIFEPGSQNTGFYRMPFGNLSISVTTQQMDVALTADGGTLALDYLMEVGGMPPIRNRMDITLRRMTDGVI